MYLSLLFISGFYLETLSRGDIQGYCAMHYGKPSRGVGGNNPHNPPNETLHIVY